MHLISLCVVCFNLSVKSWIKMNKLTGHVLQLIVGLHIPNQQPSITKEGRYQIAPLHNASLVNLVIINAAAKGRFPAIWCSANKTALFLNFL